MKLSIILWIAAFCGVALAETWPECQARCKSQVCGASWNSQTGCKCVSCIDNYGPKNEGGESQGFDPKIWKSCISKCTEQKCTPTYSSVTGCKCTECIKLKDRVTDDQKQLFVDLHNKYRRKVAHGQTKEPSAANMMEVVWDDKIAAVAQNWADKCEFEHSEEDYGENLADNPSIESTVKHWFDEIKDYDFHTKECSGKACGHYTQVVWGTSDRIGCGINRCIGRKAISNALIVCNYAPAGNYDGENPYVKGPACSKCPENTQCHDGLCERAD